MKLKQATQLVIIGVIFQLASSIIYFLINCDVLTYIDPETQKAFWYFKYLSIFNILGYALLLLFFIILFKNQKK